MPSGDLRVYLWAGVGAEEQEIQECKERELEHERHCNIGAERAAVLSRFVLEFDGAVSEGIRIRGQAARSNSL